MKIKIFEAFAGIGAQRAALKKLNLDYEVVGISEWYINALHAYKAIHESENIDVTNIDTKEMREELSKYTFSWDSTKPYNINRLSDNAIEDLYITNKSVKNLGSITEITLSQLEKLDMLVYSFPCQDLSTGGKTLGMAKGSGTRSGLLWEIERILIDLKEHDKLPNYLLLENVKAILAKSNSEDFSQWKKFLESIGYQNEECKVLNAEDFGVPQHRERVFMLSQLKSGKVIQNFHEKLEIVRKRYKAKQKPIKEFLSLSKDEHIDEQNAAQLNRTPSREKMWKINKRDINDEHLIVNTIHCNLDRSNTAAMFKYKGIKGDSYRLLTMREAFLLMGFTEEDFDKVNSLGLSYRQLNKLIGNSIVVDVLAAQFEVLFGGEFDD